jgi:hypothetical protein
MCTPFDRVSLARRAGTSRIAATGRGTRRALAQARPMSPPPLPSASGIAARIVAAAIIRMQCTWVRAPWIRSVRTSAPASILAQHQQIGERGQIERTAGHGEGDKGVDDGQRQREDGHHVHQYRAERGHHEHEHVDQADPHEHDLRHGDEAIGHLLADPDLADRHVLAGLGPGERHDGHLALARDDDRALARAHRGDLADRHGQRVDVVGAEHPLIQVGDVHGAAGRAGAALPPRSSARLWRLSGRIGLAVCEVDGPWECTEIHHASRCLRPRCGC